LTNAFLDGKLILVYQRSCRPCEGMDHMPRTQCFDENYKRYNDWFDRNPFVYQSEIEAVKHFIPPDGEGIEIGIGSGKFAKPLGIKKGIEPSLKMRQLAVKEGLDVLDAMAEALPFDDSSFDYALMVTTLCFVDDVRQAFREAWRVLRDNGAFIIGFVDKDSPLGQVYEAHKSENVFYKDAVFYSTEDVIALLRETQFDQIETVQTIFRRSLDLEEVQEYKEGYGSGGFVVIRAIKNSSQNK
jgi:ubiquinone/menaquinone biosynthesis C-methylase UbiE